MPAGAVWLKVRYCSSLEGYWLPMEVFRAAAAGPTLEIYRFVVEGALRVAARRKVRAWERHVSQAIVSGLMRDRTEFENSNI
jgi:hypothetical protein